LVLVHEQCAKFVPVGAGTAAPTMAYRATSAEPDGTSCKVEIVELPQAQRYRRAFGVLQRPPAHVPEVRWRQCVKNGSRFLARWGSQAEALGWDSQDLFGLHTPPANPHPSYNRLSRYNATGLCWLLEGRKVLALTEATATTLNPDTGAITTYRRFGKPTLGPLSDSLDDLNDRAQITRSLTSGYSGNRDPNGGLAVGPRRGGLYFEKLSPDRR